MIDADLAAALRSLVQGQRIAALGTLHGGEPFVSMVPFALHEGCFVIHVSALAAHTKDMVADGRVSLMVSGQPNGDVTPQAVPRVTVQGDAARIEAGGAHHAAAKDAYLARFPEAEPMFGFGDFSLFAIEPRSARFVGGFAQAKSLTGETLAQILV